MLNIEQKVTQNIDGQNEKPREQNVKNVVKIIFVNDLGKNIQKFMGGRSLK
jgi:hypothetical protein